MPKRCRGFGRELDAIIRVDDATVPRTNETLESISIRAIQPNRFQPRTVFEPEALEELVSSIRRQGVLQPIIVRPSEGSGYELIAGERRWRAAGAAGLEEISAVVRDINDREAVALALVENLQREDLNPIDEARGLKRLVEEFELSHQEAGDAVGRSRVAVSNLLRLLDLHADVQSLVVEGRLEMGHARALLGLEYVEQPKYALRIVEQRLSVRQTEELVRSAGRAGSSATPSASSHYPEVPDKWRGRVLVSQSKTYGTELRIRSLTEQELHAILRWLADCGT